jgi:hypothetical protein
MAHGKRFWLVVSMIFALGLFAGDAAVQGQQPPNLWQFPQLTNSRFFQRWWWAFHQRAYPLGYIPEGARQRALEQIEQAKAALSPMAQPVQGDTWVNIGPAPILGGQTSPPSPVSGRVAAIAVDPSNANHWLIGAAQGGVWETHDAGTIWAAKTDDQASLAMGAIAFAPRNPDTIYAGTGEAHYSADSYGGAGLLKSTDGGTTWQLLATSTFRKTGFSDLKVDPTNPNTVLAATTRGFAGRVAVLPPSLPPRGILKSTDGGQTWSLNLSGETTDLEVDPGSFNRQYAGIGDPIGGATNGVYRSTNGGDTWTLVSGPWSSLSAGVGRVELAIAPSNANVLYVSIQDAFGGGGNDGGLLGLWKTSNAWDPTPTWARITTVPQYCDTQCWYDHELIVDPTNPNILYAGGASTTLFKLNGTTWTNVTDGLHADLHSLAWAGNRLIVGTDGGVWSSTNGGNTWTNHNTTLAITQFYDGSLHPTDPNFALAGSQDNGTEKWTGTDAWQWIFGGDGADNAISSSNPNTNWAVSFQMLAIRRTTNGGASFTVADTGIDHTNAPFIARFEKCPANDNVFIAGTDNLWKTTNFFNSAPGRPSWSSNSPEMGSGLSALAFAASDPNCLTYAFGTANGQLRLTANGGSTYVDIDAGNAVPNRGVTALAFNPTNASVLYVTLSGFDEGTPGQPGHVFKTTNALAASPTWVNVSPPVNIPHNTIVLDPSDPTIVYIGTDLGVWMSTNGGSTWTQMGPETGLPNVAVFELQISDTTDRLVAFTHGRGAFALEPF